MAEFYGTLAGALTYHADRGNAAWASSNDTLRTAALVRATTYIDATYRGRFPGYRTARRAQSLEWPRTDAWDATNGVTILSTEVPIEVERAAYEAALRELASPGSLNPDITPGKIKKSVAIAGAVSVEYANTSGAGGQRPVVSIIDGILAPLLCDNSGYSGKAVRG